MRIDKFISEMKIASRKEAAGVARKGGVLVNGAIAKDLSKHINPDVDRVTYLGEELTYKKYVFVMLNKPEGYVSATEDASLPPVTDLLPRELAARGLFPVGRLDKDTLGLMILTNDGETSHRLLSPKRHVLKKYAFTLAEPMKEGAEEEFCRGVVLADGYECKSAQIELEASRKSGVITLTEGKYHQIKRMAGALGNRITYLERIEFAGIPLDRGLSRGEWRYLTEEETAELYRLASL